MGFVSPVTYVSGYDADYNTTNGGILAHCNNAAEPVSSTSYTSVATIELKQKLMPNSRFLIKGTIKADSGETGSWRLVKNLNTNPEVLDTGDVTGNGTFQNEIEYESKEDSWALHDTLDLQLKTDDSDHDIVSKDFIIYGLHTPWSIEYDGSGGA